MNKWISTKEQWPEPFLDVLCCMKDGTMAVGCYDSKYEFGRWTMNIDENYCQDIAGKPLYWMPLPKSPIKEDHDD